MGMKHLLLAPFTALAAVLVLSAFAIGTAAQEPTIEADPWLEKLRGACAAPAPEQCTAGLVLNPEETQALFDRMVDLENARVLDVSFSNTRVYVLSVDGRVLATTELPEHAHQEQ